MVSVVTGPLRDYLPSQVPERWARLIGEEGLDILRSIGQELDQRPANKALITPAPQNILRALKTPPHAVKAVIIGQDPYPGAGHAQGLAFSVDKHVSPLPPSLLNIRVEYRDDVGLPLPSHGDLSRWADNGVLLLNRHLTTVLGAPGAHRSLGWSRFTDLLISKLAESNDYFVAVLWGREAAELAPLLAGKPRIESAHPSPLSARLGFFGSKPFSRVNDYLDEAGLTPVDWYLGES